MRRNKLLDLLRLLSQEDLLDFDRYLNASILPIPSRVLDAWNEAIAGEVGKPGEKWNWEKLETTLLAVDRRVRSELFARLQSFLAWDLLKEEKGLEQILSLRAMNKRGIDGDFSGLQKKAGKVISHGDTHAFLLQLLLQEETLSFQSQNPKRFPRPNLDLVLDRLDEFYLVSKLKYACARATEQKILSQEQVTRETPFLVPIINFLESHPSSDHAFQPLTRLYFFAYQTLVHADGADDPEPYFDRLLALLTEHSGTLEKSELTNLYSLAMNHCARQINLYNSARHDHLLLNLYVEQLNSGMLVDDEGFLAPQIFKNIATLMARHASYDQLQQLIKNYGDKLSFDPDQVGKAFARGLLEFYQGHYSRSYALFAKVIGNSEDVFFGLDARAFQLKVCYLQRNEARGYDQLDHAINSFRMALSRRTGKLATVHKENYLEFIRYVSAMGRIAEEVDREKQRQRLDRISKELQAAVNVAAKGWIEEQLQLLGE